MHSRCCAGSRKASRNSTMFGCLSDCSMWTWAAGGVQAGPEACARPPHVSTAPRPRPCTAPLRAHLRQRLALVLVRRLVVRVGDAFHDVTPPVAPVANQRHGAEGSLPDVAQKRVVGPRAGRSRPESRHAQRERRPHAGQLRRESGASGARAPRTRCRSAPREPSCVTTCLRWHRQRGAQLRGAARGSRPPTELRARRVSRARGGYRSTTRGLALLPLPPPPTPVHFSMWALEAARSFWSGAGSVAFGV